MQKSYLHATASFSIAVFVLAGSQKIMRSFYPQCVISAYTEDYELKFSIQINLSTLISKPKLHFQYNTVMTS